MEKVVTKTVDALSRFGERLERRLSTGDDDNSELNRSGSAFQRPLDKKHGKSNYSSKQRDAIYGNARNYSSDNLAASGSGQSSFNNYRQNPMGNPYADRMIRPPYGYGMGGSMNYGYGGGYPGQSPAAPYGANPGSVGYAPDYYVAERRQLELVPNPPPRYIRQQVPVPYPVDRPVPQPYPVQVPRPVPVDRPVPVPYPSPVPVDRPVPVPVAVPVPSRPPPPIQVPVPVPVPSPVPYYIPVGVPVPSPPPSPVMFENSVTHTQRWVTNSPDMMNQQRYSAGSPVMMNQQGYLASSPQMMNQQRYSAGSPVMMNQQGYFGGSPQMMNQQRYMAGSPVMGMNPCGPYGNGSFMR